MILFCGIPSEPPLTLAIEAAARLGFDHLVFNQRWSRHCDIALDHCDGKFGGFLWTQDREWRLETFTGVYTRMIESDTLPENRVKDNSTTDYLSLERSAFLNQALSDWIEVADCRVVNRARACASNVSKPFQAQVISQFFATPETLVTNDPAVAREFIQTHGRVVYKSISSIRSIVREWSSSDEKNLDKIRVLPTQFQGFVAGTNVRVHVIGSSVFATQVNSEAVDYRYAQRDGLEIEMEEVILPQDIADGCRHLARALDLPFCGIDLKRTRENAYYCFEVNPSPAYSYYQQYTGQPIAEALVHYLEKAAN